MTKEELENRVKKLEKEIRKLKKKLNPEKKITLKEFWESKEELAILCDTEEKANMLLDVFHKIGKKWWTGRNYIDTNNCFDKYKENTGYTNRGTYINCSMKPEYKTYEFEDIDLTIPLKYQFSEDEKTILRNIDKKYKWIARDKNSNLYAYEAKPNKNTFMEKWRSEGFAPNLDIFFNHLFQFIKWEDDEPVEISKIIEGNENYDR